MKSWSNCGKSEGRSKPLCLQIGIIRLIKSFEFHTCLGHFIFWLFLFLVLFWSWPIFIWISFSFGSQSSIFCRKLLCDKTVYILLCVLLLNLTQRSKGVLVRVDLSDHTLELSFGLLVLSPDYGKTGVVVFSLDGLRWRVLVVQLRSVSFENWLLLESFKLSVCFIHFWQDIFNIL